MNQPVTQTQLLALIQQLKAENDKLKANQAKAKPFGLKVSEKGALSVYGLGRFPVTLYKSQWQTLLAHTKDIEEALTNPALKSKED